MAHGTPGPHPSAPPTASRPPARSRALGWTITILLGALVVLCSLINLGLVALETGPDGLLIGAVLAILPVPIYATLALWLDRFEAEPPQLLLLAFFWGASIAIFFAALFNTLSFIIVAAALGEGAGEFASTVISAPIVEESAKGLALLIFYLWKRDEFDGVIDGIVYAAMVGLGFAMTENISYYGRALIEGGAEATAFTVVLRGVMGPYAHPLFTSMFGIGLGLARQTHRPSMRWLAPIGGLLLAMLLHATWNFTAGLGLAFFVAYLVVMVPVFVAVLGLVYTSLRREGNLIRQHLLDDMRRGRITAAEYQALATTRGRISASWRALMRGGFSAWRAQGRLHQLESELAFHRYRVARGIHPPDEREAAYLRRLYALRTGDTASIAPDDPQA